MIWMAWLGLLVFALTLGIGIGYLLAGPPPWKPGTKGNKK